MASMVPCSCKVIFPVLLVLKGYLPVKSQIGVLDHLRFPLLDVLARLKWVPVWRRGWHTKVLLEVFPGTVLKALRLPSHVALIG